MNAYILQPKNYTNLQYFSGHASQKRFILFVHSVVQCQFSEIIIFAIKLEEYSALFSVPVYIKAIEYSDLMARGPPSERVQEVY